MRKSNDGIDALDADVGQDLVDVGMSSMNISGNVQSSGTEIFNTKTQKVAGRQTCEKNSGNKNHIRSLPNLCFFPWRSK